MRRRLYFVLPDLENARAMRDEMLLARIEIKHLHFLARRGALPADLPEATAAQKTDIVHGAQLGIVIGGVAGAVGGLVVVVLGASLKLVVVLIGALLGAGFGAWASSLAASAVPNTKLRAFQEAIEQGKVLMMADVPVGRVEEIRELAARRHPEALSGGVDPTIPAFP